MRNMDVTETIACENPHTVTRGCNSQNSFSPSLKDDFVGLSETESVVLDGPRMVVGMHWLRGTVLDTKKNWLVEKMCVLFGSQFDENEYGFWQYDRHYKWPCGAMVLFHSTEAGSDLTLGRIALEIPGKALEGLDTWYIGQFCCALANHGFQASRIDLFCDDHRRVITPGRLYNTIYEPGLFADDSMREDFMHFRVISNRSRAKKGVGLIHDEVTFGLRGSNGSGKYLRCYDKALESGGENKGIRWELELSRAKAKTAFADIVRAFSGGSDSKTMVDVIGRIIGGAIDFRRRTERIGDKNLERLERYHFWGLILEGIGSAVLAVKKIEKTIKKAKTWVGQQVVGTLQMLRKALGAEEFVAFVVEQCLGSDRLRPHHERIIAAYRQQLAAGGVPPEAVPG